MAKACKKCKKILVPTMDSKCPKYKTKFDFNDPNTYVVVTPTPRKVTYRTSSKAYTQYGHQTTGSQSQTSQYKPQCPTCQSPDVEKIGAGEKAVSGFFFGLFSNKIRKQYRCKNCGFMW